MKTARKVMLGGFCKAHFTIKNEKFFLCACDSALSLENDKSIKFFSFYPFLPELLSGTLRTYQRAACDNEYLQLSCPRGTTISIEFAQYEKSSNANGELCPDATQNTQNDGSVITSGTEIEIKASEKCKWPTQVSSFWYNDMKNQLLE